MRDVRSRGYYEQMKGRGVRSLSFDDLRRVSLSADCAKDRFVLIDAVGVEKSCKTESRPLEKKPGVALKDLLQGVAMGSRDDDTVLSLANRLVRLSKQLDPKAQARIAKISGGATVADLAKSLIHAVDPDEVVKTALATAQANGLDRTEQTLSDTELAAARQALVTQACAPFDKPELRDGIESARREREQILDHLNIDTVTNSGFSDQMDANAQKAIQTFVEFIATHKDEIEALSFFYQQPYQRRTLTFEMIEELHDHLGRPPLMLTTEKLWSAYARVQSAKVGGTGTQRQLTDLVALVRFAIGLDEELKPFRDQVDKRFQEWIFRHNAQRATAFTPEQMDWLRLMKDHLASSCSISRADFDFADFARKGGLQKAWAVFGATLDPLMDELNREMVA
jgi:type I restriction enzyme R subunit